MNKTIWMCWFQGEENFKPLNKKCVDRWKSLNSDWEINILNDETISNYTPEYIKILKESPKRTAQARSDLLRILLLSKYGGVWVDVSVYPMQPLSDFYSEVVNDTGFFTYRFFDRSFTRGGDRETVSWFLCTDKAHHPLIEKWKTNFIDKFKSKDVWKFYTFHETLTHLYDNDTQIQYILDNMIQIDQAIPHSALKDWKDRKDSFVYKRPDFETFMNDGE